ncbi:LysR family transcriptional regulator [Fischerella sp. JS2]|uniref:LysR family transcriptional regulator n=1 Tax=Fischerella sp. JS2 TaxID=2597771 RepID=UPI0028EF3BE7|nr:LysR family transcriptional regulator [Fischerella sp. JS2]
MEIQRLQDFELRHLRYFIAVAENKNCSISEVAEELHMAQPNLSQQLKDLETKLKVKLFDRQKRPLRLTNAGVEFLKQARLILAQVNHAIETAQQASQGTIGRLIVGFNSSVSNSVLPDLLRKFRNYFPKVKLILQERTAYSLIEGLQTQQIDIGLMHWSSLNSQDETLCVKKIQEESLVLALPENHPFVTQQEISLKSLSDESFILPPSHLPYSLYESIVSFWKQIEFVPKEIQEATLMLTILSLVAGGVGVALLPANAQNIGRKGVIYRAIQEQTPTLEIVAVWRRDRSSTVLQNFLEVIQTIAT